MLTAILAASLLVQQPKTQARPRQQQADEITIQGRDFSIPHVPATVKQANKEYKATLKKIDGTMGILEDDLTSLYKKFNGAELLRDFTLSDELAASPEAKFFSSVLKDEKLESLVREIIRQWNEWQRATVQAGAGKMDLSKNPQSQANPQADSRPDRLPGVKYEKQKFTVENVPFDVIPALRASLDAWDVKLEVMKNVGSKMRTVQYQLELPTVSSLQSALGLSKSDAKKIRNQKALSMLAIFSTAKMSLRDGTEEEEPEIDPADMEELEVEIAGTARAKDAEMRLKFQVTQLWADSEVAKVVSGLYAPDFSKTWETLMEYMNKRIPQFAEMEARPIVYQNDEMKFLYDMASVVFMEQLRVSLWICQNVWYRMADRITENPKPLQRLGPYIVRAADAGNPGSHIILTDMDKKEVDKLVEAITKNGPRLLMTRQAQPIYVPNEGEVFQAENTIVMIQVAMDGSVSDTEYVRGPEHLRELSLQAAKLLKFFPLKALGFDIPQLTEVTFSFD